MRLYHRFKAWALGYFWLPCPICGRDFGGHEGQGIRGSLWDDPTGSSGRITCPQCPGSWIKDSNGVPQRIS